MPVAGYCDCNFEVGLLAMSVPSKLLQIFDFMFPIRKIYFFKMFPVRKIFFSEMYHERKILQFPPLLCMLCGNSSHFPSKTHFLERMSLKNLHMSKYFCTFAPELGAEGI